MFAFVLGLLTAIGMYRSLGGLAGSNLLSEASGLMGLATSGDPIIPPLIITNQSSYSKENVTLQVSVTIFRNLLCTFLIRELRQSTNNHAYTTLSNELCSHKEELFSSKIS